MTKSWADQQTPALAIVARGDQIARLTDAHYTVRSQSTADNTYNVRRTGPA